MKVICPKYKECNSKHVSMYGYNTECFHSKPHKHDYRCDAMCDEEFSDDTTCKSISILRIEKLKKLEEYESR